MRKIAVLLALLLALQAAGCTSQGEAASGASSQAVSSAVSSEEESSSPEEESSQAASSEEASSEEAASSAAASSQAAPSAPPAPSAPASSAPAPSAPASSAPASSAAASGDSALEGSLEDLMAQMYNGISADEMPMVGNIELTEDNSEYCTGVPRSQYTEGLASDAMINAQAHSVCLLRAESAEAAETLAADVEAKANPGKWICVTAEKTIVDRIDNVVILIMTSADLADRIHANFQALAQ
ncbi:MAG TPA: hypothetical protein IAB66_07915 [Candidatus Caccousia avistercoris]|nr:hypothetical protein [Candidatus Caccousia avistercoris]